MNLHCKQCEKPIAAGDINLDRALAKCAACNAVFSFADQIEGDNDARKVDRAAVGLPENMRDESSGYKLRLVRRWFSPAIFILLIFCFLWDGFLVFWYSMAFKEGAPLIMKVFPILHVLIGVGLTYGVVCGFVNRTEVEVEGGELRVRHGPLPVPGNRRLAADDLQQLYTRERLRRNRNGHSYQYEVRAKTRGGKSVSLLSGLSDPELALYYEQRIEQFLGIKDEPVRGELVRA